MKKVLLVTDGIFHPTYFGQLALHKALNSPLPISGEGSDVRADFSFEHVSSVNKLPSELESFSALILHFHHKSISDSALMQLDSFAKNGGGILAIHAATASFKKSVLYFKILGGRFIGHGKVERFKVEKVRDDIFNGIESFVVKDELYMHELEPSIEVHFTAKHEGRDIPVVWTYRYDNGKVCYAVPGHTTGTMYNETYQQVLRRGLEWVAE